MGVELKPLGVQCNIQCQYCYQHPMRDAGSVPHRYDMAKMLAALEAEGRPFGLFGGEALLMPKEDLESLWAWGFARYGRNAVQTNGSLIDDDHIRMFRQYRVHVGVSIDGPGELNDARWHGTLARTRRTTATVEAVIERLCRERLVPSIIVTLSRTNASADRLPILGEWIRSLAALGVRKVRLHLLESESASIRSGYGLSTAENIAALRHCVALERELTTLRFDLFDDMRRLLEGRDNAVTCIWTACDPYTTHAVCGVEGDGQRSNCSRTNKDGVEYVKSSVVGFERYVALALTPQDAGGCRDCRFLLMCKGQCPGTAIDGDWRNRTEHCDVWKAIFTDFETELTGSGVEPLSLSARRSELERAAVIAWSEGRSPSIRRLLET